MDELGCAIQHSDVPNVVMAPFLFAKNNRLDEEVVSFSIIWPVKDIKKGDLVFRDYVFGMDETLHRSARLTVWFETPESFFIETYKQLHVNSGL